MNPAIHIAIIVSAIALVGMAAIAVNYSPVPAHAQNNKGWCIPGTQQLQCYQTEKDCELHLPVGAVVTCQKARR